MKITADLLFVLSVNLLSAAVESANINATLNTVYNNQTTINDEVEFNFLFPMSQIGARENLKLFFSASKSRHTHPVLVTTMIQEYGVVWKVPFNLTDSISLDDNSTKDYFSFNRYKERCESDPGGSVRV